MTRPYKRAPAAAVLVFARAPTSLARVGSAKSKQPYACALRVESAVHPSVGHSAMTDEGCTVRTPSRVCSAIALRRMCMGNRARRHVYTHHGSGYHRSGALSAGCT